MADQKRPLVINNEENYLIESKKVKFDWTVKCFFCDKGEDKRSKKYLSKVGKGGEGVREKIWEAAVIREDKRLLERLNDYLKIK